MTPTASGQLSSALTVRVIVCRLHRASDGYPPVEVSRRAFRGVTPSFHSLDYQFAFVRRNIFSTLNKSHKSSNNTLNASMPQIRLALNTCSYGTDKNNYVIYSSFEIPNFGNGFHNVAICTHLHHNGGSYFTRDVSYEIDGNSTGALSYNSTKYAYGSRPATMGTGSITLYSDSYVSSHKLGTGILFIFPANGTFYVSNIIASTSPIALSSETFPVRLPLKNTSGDFISVGDGEYVGNSSGQKLLSTIDATNVIEKFGESSKVSHLVTYGAPGYRVGSNITTAYGISESNSTITSHGSTELSTDTKGTACVAWAADSGTTLPDINGLKIGWQV